MGVVGGVICAPDSVVDVLAEAGGVGAVGLASFLAECVTTHEVVPFDHLFVAAVISIAPSIGVEKTAEGVSSEISTVRIEFTSEIIGSQVDLGLVNETDDLDIVRCFHELNTLESSRWDDSGTMSRLGAPGNFELFGVTNSGWASWGCP